MDWRKKVQASNGGSVVGSDYDWIKRMNNAIAYIEENLDGDIDLGEASKCACCSAYHFGRFFSFAAGIPLSEYIRRRRLTLAAFELQSKSTKVIELALKYGYDSPESFTRAFKSLHGITPSAAKESNAPLKAYPCMSFHISIRGDDVMNYRIEQKEPFEIFGVSTEISTVENQNFTSIPAFWERCRADGTMNKIRAAAILDETMPLHAAMYNCTDTSHSYMIGYFLKQSVNPSDFVTIQVPSVTWAVFPTEELGIKEVAEQASVMWKRIFTEWFATSGYELANAPELELHYRKEDGKFLTEIWVPVVKL